MTRKPTIKARIDTRTAWKDGTHPIKLFMYYNGEQKSIACSKPLSVTKKEWETLELDWNPHYKLTPVAHCNVCLVLK